MTDKKLSELTDIGTLASSDTGDSMYVVVGGNSRRTAVGMLKSLASLGSYTIGDTLYASGAATLAKLAAVAVGGVLIANGVGAAPSWLAGQTTATKKFLTQTGTGAVSAAPAWAAIVESDVNALAPTWTGRHIWGLTPAYDLATNTLGIGIIMPLNSATQTLAASKQFNYIRLTQADGSNTVWTLGASSILTGVYSDFTAGAASDATSVAYSVVAHAGNAGAGTTRGLHSYGYGSGTSAGIVNAGNFQLAPVATNAVGSSNIQIGLTSIGANDIATGIYFVSTGDRFQYGIGTLVAPISYNIAFLQAWMATGSGANARFLQLLNNAGTEIAFWHKDGTIQSGASGVAGSITLGNATSGLLTLQPVTGALGTVTLSLPAATDTLVGKATTDELTNKTLTSSVGKGTWTASGTWTLPALTLGGTVSGGGNQLNNIIIGTSTPLAGTFTVLTGTSGSITGLTGLAIRDTSAAFDVTLAATSTSALLTAGRIVTIDVGNVAHTIALGTTANTITFPNAASGTVPLLNLAQSWTAANTYTGAAPQIVLGVNTTTLGAIKMFGNTSGDATLQPAAVAGAATVVTLPAATGTLATLAGTEELTNKTLNASVGKGTWTASGTWTLPAITLGGTVSGGGNQLNNIIIGTSTPLAGSFTTLAASTTATITSANAAALAVGLAGATNPAFVIDASTALQAAGLKVTGAATGGTVAIAAIDSGLNTNLTINGKGTGTIGIGSVSTGAVTITPALTLSAALTYGGVTLTNNVTGTGKMVLDTTPTFTTSALFPDGAVGTPSIAHAGDTNTGIYFPAADTIDIVTAGSGRVRISSGGIFQVGTTSGGGASEIATFQGAIIVGDATTAYANPTFLLGNTGAGTAVVGGLSNHDVEMRANNIEVIRLIAAAAGGGNVKFTNAGNWTANGTVATTMTSLGPTGASTTILEWLTVKNAAGTTRYIPCY